MQKRLVQAAATVLLFTTFAVPAFAHGNDKDKGRDKREDKRQTSDSRKDDRGFHLGWFKHIDIKLPVKPPVVDSTCLANAKIAKKYALTLAQDTFNDANAAARNVYLSAVGAAAQTRASARASAGAAFVASDKGLVAWRAYLSARATANNNYDLSVRSARATWNAAKNTAQAAMDAARAKAIADLQAAEASCPATTPPTVSDVTAPAAISSLSLSGVTASSVILSWNATGDDSFTGTAASYDVRYSTSPISAANFASAAAVTGEPVPAASGTMQSMTVSGLTAGTTYYFAIKAADEASNVSALSNVVSATTSAAADTVAPSVITDLSLSGVTSSSVILNWTAPGDDANMGTAASYDIRYSTAVITGANFASATATSNEPIPTPAGTSQFKTVTGLSAGTTYFFAIKATDDASNVSGLSNVASIQTSP